VCHVYDGVGHFAGPGDGILTEGQACKVCSGRNPKVDVEGTLSLNHLVLLLFCSWCSVVFRIG
jgi:hypothetical protein